MPSYLLLIGLVALIILPPIAVGSVYIATYSAVEIMVFGLLLLHLWRSDFSLLRSSSENNSARSIRHSALSFTIVSRNYLRNTLLVMLPMFIFLAVILFQMIPLPLNMVRTLSPQTVVVYEKTYMALNGQHSTLNTSWLLPLTLSVHITAGAFLKWAAYVGAFFLTATYAPKDVLSEKGRWIKILLTAAFLIGFAEAVYGLYQYLNRSDALLWFIKKYNIGTAATGTYINPDHLAGLLNNCLFLSIGLLLLIVGDRKRKVIDAAKNILSSGKAVALWFLLFGLCVMILSLFFSFSRAGHISIMAGFCLLGIFFSLKNMRIYSVLLLVIVAAGLVWGLWKGLEPVEAKWRRIDSSYKDRSLIWESGLRIYKDYPITGTGSGTFALVFPQYKLTGLDMVSYDHAHNDYLEILSETGSVGFAAWIFFILLYFCVTFIVWFRRRDVLARVLGAAGLAAVAAILVHSGGDFNLQIPANVLLLFMTMGLTWRAVHTSFK